MKKAGTIAGATERDLTFTCQSGGEWSIIDLGKAMSITNNRLYRQGMVYSASLELTDVPENEGKLEVFTVPNTWYLRKAYELARKKHDEVTKSERRAGVQRGRWNDFRIHPLVDSNTRNPTTWSGAAVSYPDPQRLTPGATMTSLSADEYTYTRVEHSAGVTKSFHYTGEVNPGVSFNILYQYDMQADTEVDGGTPNPESLPYEDLEDDHSDVEADNIASGGSAPYDMDRLHNNLQLRHHLQTTASGVYRLQTPRILIPLGFLYVRTTGFLNAPVKLTVRMAPGGYKGVHAEPMLQTGA
jgi:hypothetical protein